MEIQNENIFNNVLTTGLNLFTGAGFSLLATNENNGVMFLGDKLRDDLVEHFKLASGFKKFALDRIAELLEARHHDEFRKYITPIYTTKKLDKRYYQLEKLPLKHIFTTNIEDIFFDIFSKSNTKILQDVIEYGPATDANAVEYLALHGCVKHIDRKYVFSKTSINLAAADNPATWCNLSDKLSRYPTLFWGHAIEDSGLIQSLARVKFHKNKWILLHNPANEDIEYFRSIGFFTIIGDTNEMLDYIANINIVQPNPAETYKVINWGKDSVPSIAPAGATPIEFFFEGNPPTWNLIFSKKIPETHHISEIIDRIHSKQHIIVSGIPACGKTTIMMQVAVEIKFEGYKLIGSYISNAKAQFIVNKLNGAPAIIFIDDLSSSVDAVLLFFKHKNIQIVGFERENNLSIIKYKLPIPSKCIYDISTLNDDDLAAIARKIPRAIRKHDDIERPKMDQEIPPSIFEVIENNIKFSSVRERYGSLLRELRGTAQAEELFILVCYVNSCRTPLSMEMIMYFFKEDWSNYKQIYDLLLSKLNKLVWNADELTQYNNFINDDQDFFVARSNIIAETVLKMASPEILKKTILQFYENVSQTQIYNYHKFKYMAFDAKIMKRAFEQVEEGKAFYEDIFNKTGSPFVLQQGALYLKDKKLFTDAFDLVERARQLTGYRIFSITNTYAIILFDANINTVDSEVKRDALIKSMEILSNCYRKDNRKTYHAIVFADHAISFWKTYHDEISRNYLSSAFRWLEEEQRRDNWNLTIKSLHKKVGDICRTNSIK